MVNSIKKGKKWERKVAKYLTKWTDVNWHRVPQSGATATANDISMVQMQGDVFTEAKDYKDICVECKVTEEDINLNKLANPNSQIFKWIKQAETESKEDWILFFKIDYKGEYLLSTSEEKMKPTLEIKTCGEIFALLQGYYEIYKIKEKI